MFIRQKASMDCNRYGHCIPRVLFEVDVIFCCEKGLIGEKTKSLRPDRSAYGGMEKEDKFEARYEVPKLGVVESAFSIGIINQWSCCQQVQSI